MTDTTEFDSDEMSKSAGSPTPFSGDADHFYDPNFTAEISQKMRVPKRIKVDGESDDPPMVNGGPNFNSWPYGEKFDMRVPEKIVVLGYDKHMGAKALPREFELENAIPPPDPALIRVQTPPRVITLDKHCFPSVVDDMVPPPLYGNHIQDHQVMGGSRVHRGYMADVMAVPTHNGHHHIGDMSSATLNDSLGQVGEGMTVSEEVAHLRQQLAKLNRRVMSMELDNMQRQQRERLFYIIGLGYLFLKTVVWLSRSSSHS